MIRSGRTIDETILIDQGLPKSWKCPHCGRRNKFGQDSEDILIEFGNLILHCDYCTYLHFWKLKLTDDFKKQVIKNLTGGEL